MDNKDDITISFNDILSFWKKHQKFLWSIGLAAFLLSFLFLAAWKPLKYSVNAKFHEVQENASNLSPMYLANLEPFPLLIKSKDTTIPVMLSDQSLSKLIASFNLQAKIESRGKIRQTLGRIGDNIVVEKAWLLRNKNPDKLLIEDRASEIFCHSIFYDGEFPLTLKLHVKKSSFVIKTPDGKKIKGQLDKPVSAPLFKFTISKAQADTIKSKKYTLRLLPLKYVLNILTSNLTINKDYQLVNVVNLSYSHRDRHLATNVVNSLMKEYKNYISIRNKNRSEYQLEYLEKKKKDTIVNLENVMGDRAEKLASGLNTNGLMELEQELKILSNREEGLQRKLLAINLDLSLLNSPKAIEHFAIMPSTPNGANDILSQLRSLQQRRDALLALKNEGGTKEGQDFQGMDLNASEKFHSTYSEQLENNRVERTQLEFILPQVERESFEISSLLSILNDRASQTMIEKANTSIQMLRDEAHVGLKEQKRLSENVSLQRKAIVTHISQLIELCKIREGLLNEKIVNLQIASLGLVDRSISILEEHLSKLMLMQKKHLIEERSLIEAELRNLNGQLAKLPQKWLHEQKMNLFVNMEAQSVQTISNLIASKNISHDLASIESGPLNVAMTPVLPDRNKLLNYAFLVAFVMIVSAFSILFFKDLRRREIV